MTGIENLTEWAQQEPQRSLIECAERLEDQDHSADTLADAMMTISLHMQSKMHGPRAVAARLLMLADKFSGEASRLEREARDAAVN